MILTPTQFREHMADDVALNDDVLTVWLDANERAIERRVGSMHASTETVYAYGLTLLPLRSAPLSVTTVTDILGTTETELDADEYRIRGGTLEKVTGYWGNRTVVEYVPEAEAAERIAVLVLLMKCDLNYEPGIFSQSGGGAFEQYGQNHLAERARILDRLGPEPLFA